MQHLYFHLQSTACISTSHEPPCHLEKDACNAITEGCTTIPLSRSTVSSWSPNTPRMPTNALGEGRHHFLEVLAPDYPDSLEAYNILFPLSHFFFQQFVLLFLINFHPLKQPKNVMTSCVSQLHTMPGNVWPTDAMTSNDSCLSPFHTPFSLFPLSFSFFCVPLLLPLFPTRGREGRHCNPLSGGSRLAGRSRTPNTSPTMGRRNATLSGSARSSGSTRIIGSSVGCNLLTSFIFHFFLLFFQFSSVFLALSGQMNYVAAAHLARKDKTFPMMNRVFSIAYSLLPLPLPLFLLF